MGLSTSFDSPATLLEPAREPRRAKRRWEQLVCTLEEIAPGAKPLPPSQMLASVYEAIYNDYLKLKFTNYEARREDLKTLTNFARQYDDPR